MPGVPPGTVVTAFSTDISQDTTIPSIIAITRQVPSESAVTIPSTTAATASSLDDQIAFPFPSESPSCSC